LRDLLRRGGSGVLLVLIMLGGGVVLWIGVPLAWLYIGSLVQGETQSLGIALTVMMFGVAASIAVIVAVLVWLNRKHVRLQEARGLDHHGQTPLESVMTVSAGLALVAFGAWFFLFAGSSPLPTGLGF
jgi:heme/copper-type cytochrome/quinol oxidase subunit 2